jgi:hypothetical protein
MPVFEKSPSSSGSHLTAQKGRKRGQPLTHDLSVIPGVRGSDSPWLVPREITIQKNWVGWGSNPQPTPKAFGAAPPLSYLSGSARQVDGDLRAAECVALLATADGSQVSLPSEHELARQPLPGRSPRASFRRRPKLAPASLPFERRRLHETRCGA